jgi:hypothetical protein
MAFLTVGGVTITVAADSVRRDTEEIGDRARTFDGTYRENLRNRVFSWRGETTPLETGDATTQYNALVASTQPQTCAGDMVSTAGGSITAYTRAVRSEAIVAGSTHRLVIQWEMEASS